MILYQTNLTQYDFQSIKKSNTFSQILFYSIQNINNWMSNFKYHSFFLHKKIQYVNELDKSKFL